MQGTDLIDTAKMGIETDAELSLKIGLSVSMIRRWKKYSQITERQVSDLVARAYRAGQRESESSALRPIVEFFPIEKTLSRQAAKYEVISTQTTNGEKHNYLHGLRKELEQHSGVYIFFDSRVRTIYVGKAKNQRLWIEINQAYNHPRGQAQTIKRVNHPARNQDYKSSNVQTRQIKTRAVRLYELAAYFSAYDVSQGMFNEVEAMLVRGFANDLLNQRMELFGQQEG